MDLNVHDASVPESFPELPAFAATAEGKRGKKYFLRKTANNYQGSLNGRKT